MARDRPPRSRERAAAPIASTPRPPRRETARATSGWPRSPDRGPAGPFVPDGRRACRRRHPRSSAGLEARRRRGREARSARASGERGWAGSPADPWTPAPRRAPTRARYGSPRRGTTGRAADRAAGGGWRSAPHPHPHASFMLRSRGMASNPRDVRPVVAIGLCLAAAIVAWPLFRGDDHAATTDGRTPIVTPATPAPGATREPRTERRAEA